MTPSANGRLRRRGFTLVEVLIVLAIIMAMMALVLPRLLGTQKQADINIATIQIKAFRECLKRYSLDMKGFPDTQQGLAALVSCPADVNETAAARWKGPYIDAEELPKDPWGNDYQYEYPSTHSSDYPDIWSFGPDGEDGTEDDICSWSSTATAEASGSPAAKPAPQPKAKPVPKATPTRPTK